MMATPNSDDPFPRGRPAAAICRVACILTALVEPIFAQNPKVATPLTNTAAYFTVQAEKAFHAARARFLADTNNAEATWQFGRACFDRAEFSATPAQRSAVAAEGIAACRPLPATVPTLAAGHYYLAMNLGQMARTKSVGALPLVAEMETLFHAALALDPSFDYAGPDRCLGLLYRDAPVWPASIGNRIKARQHLTRAAEIAPGSPENHLNLLETFLRWSEPNNAQRQWKALAQCLPAARTNFAGQAWAASWADWDKRRAAVESKLREAPRPLR